jgi:polar amino acid transport system substrate-binding protein
LRPYKLGAQVGTTSYDYIKDFIRPSQTPGVYDSNNDAISALGAGQIDGIVVDLPTAFYVVAVQLDNGTIVGRLPQRGPREHFGMVFAKGNPLVRCVNKALGRLWANGTIKGLQKKYLAQAGAPDLR